MKIHLNRAAPVSESLWIVSMVGISGLWHGNCYE